MKVAVVILNWNGVKFLEDFLPSVIKFSDNAEIIVADNKSTDNSIAFLKENYPSIKIIENAENGGFAKGYNDCLKHVKAEYYVLLNSDIEVTENWIQPVIHLMESDKTIAACQPKVKAFHKKSHFEHAGAAGGFIDKDLYPFCRGRIFHEAEEDKNQYQDNTEIFWATGACMFVRSAVFQQLNGFDNSFFAHMEEIDLCWRMKNQGHKIMYCSSSTVYHVGGGTLNYMSPKKTYLNFRNNLYMIHKNYEGNLFFKVFRRLILDGIAATKFCLSGQFKHTWSVLKAHFHYYGKLSSLNKIRKELKTQNQNKNLKGIYKKSIISAFWMNKKKKFQDLETSNFH